MLEWLRAALLAAQSRSPGIRITLDVFPGTAGSRTQGVSFSLSFLSISLFFFSSARLCLAVFLFASMTFAPARTGVGFLAAERVVPRPPFQRAFTPCFPRSVLNSFGLSLESESRKHQSALEARRRPRNAVKRFAVESMHEALKKCHKLTFIHVIDSSLILIVCGNTKEYAEPCQTASSRDGLMEGRPGSV